MSETEAPMPPDLTTRNLAESRADWPTVTLGDYATLTKGLAYKGAFLNQGGPELFGLAQFSPGGGAKLDGVRTYSGKYRDKDVVRPGDILIAMTDLTQQGEVLGSPLMVPSSIGEFCLYTLDVGKIEPTERLHPRFLYYVLRSKDFGWFSAAHATGTTVRRVRPVDVLSYEFPLPPLDEQRRIAHILGTLDDRIELNRRMNETLEEMARALFRSWFVDFDPVHAKAEGRPTGLPPSIDALFPASFVPSELGEIPAGWVCGEFGDILHQRKERIGDRDATVLSAVASGELVPSDDQFRKRVYSRSIAKYITVEMWDIAYNPSRINIGSVGILKESITGAVSPVYVVARPNESYRWYFDFMFRSPLVRQYIVTLASGSVRQSLSYRDFSTIPCVIPPPPVIERFDAEWTEIRSAVIAHSAESRNLAEQRDALLPRLVSGELRLASE